MAYAQSFIIVLLASQVSIGAADAGERTILREPGAVIGQNHPGRHATKDARRIPSPRSIGLQRRSTARSRAMAKIPLCGGQTPPGPKDRCRSARRRLRMSVVGTDLT